ncbi:hypothetical protein LCGC14_2706960 [marine sediment metagenome]|uniref:Uncharacterized protein n=1 Tax=marine sediment metagenome TaxID=412755 RepID=A0A0F8ZE64_9ZZZZ
MAENNNVNSNITHVTIVEGLISQVTGHLEAINPQTDVQKVLKADVQEEIAGFRDIGLFELRKAFE